MTHSTSPTPDLTALPMPRLFSVLSLAALALFVGQAVFAPTVVAVLLGTGLAVCAGVLAAVATQKLTATLRTQETDIRSTDDQRHAPSLTRAD